MPLCTTCESVDFDNLLLERLSRRREIQKALYSDEPYDAGMSG